MLAALLAFVLGPFGVAFAALVTACMALAAAPGWVPRSAPFVCLALCAAAWILSYVARNYVGVGGMGI